EILKGALERDREAVQMLREVAQTAGNVSVAGLAALRAGQLLLALGDEAALQELRDLYAGRTDRDELFVHGLDGLCRKVRLQPGRLFPDLKLVDQAGKPFSLATCRGKLLLFLIFNVEHQASKAQLERVATLAQEPRAELAIVGLSVD